MNFKAGGYDQGYKEIKVYWGPDARCRVSFPTAIAPVPTRRFGIQPVDYHVLTSPFHYLVGQAAVDLAEPLTLKDRDWILSDEWFATWLLGLSLSSGGVDQGVFPVLGLPTNFFTDQDIQMVADRVLGVHKVQREGYPEQTFTIKDCRVIPQPYGTLLSLGLTHTGKQGDPSMFGYIGIVDIGGKTTNYLSVKNGMNMVAGESKSITVGGWNVVQELGAWIDDTYRGLELNVHEIAQVMQTGTLSYEGKSKQVSAQVAEIAEPFARKVYTEATHLWNGGKGMDEILITGGGSLLLGKLVRKHLGRGTLVKDPVFANAMGYYNFARMLQGKGIGVS